MGGHQANSSTHLELEGTIFYDGNGHHFQAFKQNDNAKALNISDDNFEYTSECYFKHQKTRHNLVYYDEANSHLLDVDVFFTNVPTST